MITPVVSILRVDASATTAPPPSFLRLLTRARLDSDGAKRLAEFCTEGGVARAVLVLPFNEVRVERAESVIGAGQGEENGSKPLSVLTVCLVDHGAILQDNKAIVEGFSKELGNLPWSPEVIVACIRGRDEAVAALGATLDAHFSGASIQYLDLCPDGREPDSFWWWRHHQRRVAVLTTSGDKPSDGLEKILAAVREAGIEKAGDTPVILTPEKLLASSAEFSEITLIVLDLHDKWAFAGGPPISARQKDEHDEARKAFMGRMAAAIGLGCEVRLSIPRNRALKHLHPEILNALGSSPATLPDIIFVPIGTQLRSMSAEMRRGLAGLSSVEGAEHRSDASKLPSRADLEAERTALIGQREVITQRMALQEVRGGGDLATRLNTLFEASRRELQRIIDHEIEVMTRELRVGAYPGIDGTATGLGSRGGDRWDLHCRLRDHLFAGWTHYGQPDDGGWNWVIATPEPSGGVAKVTNRRRTMESHPRVQALIAKAVSRKCEDSIARLALATDLFIEAVVRGESRAILRELQPDDVTDEAEPSKHADPLPSGAHQATGLSGRRASELVSAERLRAGVATWPRVEKVPHHLNVGQNLKSVGLLMRQAGKLGAALVVVAAFFPAMAGKFEPPTWTQVQEHGLWVIPIALLVLSGAVWLSANAHLAQIAEKLDKLRDDTHRALEDAAAKQLAVARRVISAIVSDDLDALRADLQLAIQARDGKALNSLAADLKAIETRIADREADIERTKVQEALREKETKVRRSQTASILKKFFSLRGLVK